MTQRSHLTPLALSLALTLAGCATPTGSDPLGTTSRTAPQEAQKQGATTNSSALIGLDAASINAGPHLSRPAEDFARGEAAMAPSAGDFAQGPAASPPGAAGPGELAANPTQVSAGDLKAGSVDDNDGFAAYTKYLNAFDWDTVTEEAKPRKQDVSARHIIRVEDASGTTVPDAEVVVNYTPDPVGQAGGNDPGAPPSVGVGAPREVKLRTYADGRALFHPAAEGMPGGSFILSASKNGITAQANVTRAEEKWVVKLAEPLEPQRTAIPLDLAIVLDTTGSMGGEISKFQTTIDSIVERINNLPQKPSLRLGLVAYRDQEEAYVTKVHAFTDSAGEFRRSLNELSAGGGGDMPEDMEAALKDTLGKLTWREDSALRLSFVVADAAPHTDYAQSTPYTDSMRLAASKGIKFYTIGASGLAPEGEYVMRQLAQWTLGQYMFVTRGGDEGSGGGTASAKVDQYSEGRLDDIVVERVAQELKKFAGE
jgi:hypothetical protein